MTAYEAPTRERHWPFDTVEVWGSSPHGPTIPQLLDLLPKKKDSYSFVYHAPGEAEVDGPCAASFGYGSRSFSVKAAGVSRCSRSGSLSELSSFTVSKGFLFAMRF